MAGSAVLVVGGKVAQPQELEAIRRGAVPERLFHLAAGENFERVGVQAVDEVLAGRVRLGVGEEHIVEPHLGVGAVGGVSFETPPFIRKKTCFWACIYMYVCIL